MTKNAVQLLLLIVSLTMTSSNYARLIMVFGDSLSAGYGMKIEQGWVKLLEHRLTEKKTGYSLVNASISGNTSGNGLGRFSDDVKLHKPDILILELGGNDGLRGHPIQLFKSNMAKIIQQALSKNIKILVLGIKLPPSYGKRYGEAFESVYRELGATYPVSLVPYFMNKVGGNSLLMQNDGIHPNADGQPQLLENVWPALKVLMNK